MSKRLLTLAISLLVLWLAFCGTRSADADHGAVKCGGTGQQACILLSTQLVEKYIKPGGEVTWCINPRGMQYPGFHDQTDAVMKAWAKKLRFTVREVAYPDSIASTACVVRHDMLDNHPCSACGAWIYLANMPVTIEYNAKAGYSVWLSTSGHEVGHGFCLLDEHYDKAGFRSYILNFGKWIHGEPTVMDVGTWALTEYYPNGIWEPTEYDLNRCSETLGRSVGNTVCTGDPCWDGAYWKWGTGWAWKASTDQWFYKDVLYWGPRESWGGRYSPALREALYSGTPYWAEAVGTWNVVP